MMVTVPKIPLSGPLWGPLMSSHNLIDRSLRVGCRDSQAPGVNMPPNKQACFMPGFSGEHAHSGAPARADGGEDPSLLQVRKP